MRNKLDRAWRVLATGVSFLVFAVAITGRR
jgi:hypothetical protein